MAYYPAPHLTHIYLQRTFRLSATMPSALNVLDVALALLGVLIVKAIVARKRHPTPLPPGPKGLPIIGNVLDMPTSHEWYKFAEWGERYGTSFNLLHPLRREPNTIRQTGSIISLNLLGQPLIVLNSAAHAVALLDKRSTIYSDRPVLTMGGELVGWKYTLALTPYGERFREYRKFIARLVGGHAQMQPHLALAERETRRFLLRVLQDPGNVPAHIRKYVLSRGVMRWAWRSRGRRRTAGAIILKLSHGYEVQEGEDPIVNLVDTATEQFSLATAPGAFLVDVFPLLRYVPSWFPGAGFQKTAKEWKDIINQMADVPHEFVKQRMVGLLVAYAPHYLAANPYTERPHQHPKFHIGAIAEPKVGRRQGVQHQVVCGFALRW